MPRHSDFTQILNRFTSQYGTEEGKGRYYAWITKKGYVEEKEFPKKTEKKEMLCKVVGYEIKEFADSYHILGLAATTHVDNLKFKEGISDWIPKITLDSFANQMNERKESRIVGVHHSEGKGEYFGEVDVLNNPAKVIELEDGEHGLFVDTKLLKNDPKTPEIIGRLNNGDLDSLSITYSTDNFMTTDFEWRNDELIRVLNPETKIHGYTLAKYPVNPNATILEHGFSETKEFKELVKDDTYTVKKEDKIIMDENKENVDGVNPQNPEEKPEEKVEEKVETNNEQPSEVELKEFADFRANKKKLEEKEFLKKVGGDIAERVMSQWEKKEQVLKQNSKVNEDIAIEEKEFGKMISNSEDIEIKEQFRRAAAYGDYKKVAWDSKTSAVENREYKNFFVNGTKLEYKGLGIYTNQNTDPHYLQSSAELQDVYDPIIYNALNQETVTWNLLSKDDYSRKGNNYVQFKLKIASNPSGGFYSGNSITTGNIGRLKYQTKFKKYSIGVSVDGDMIAAARGGPTSDIFAQEVADSTEDMMKELNQALFLEKGAETDVEPISFEYITDSAGNPTLYSLTRTTANKLLPDSATDTYIDMGAAPISMGNLRKAKRQALKEGANKANLVFVTSPTQGDIFRGKFDDQRRLLTDRDTRFGFSTDIYVDGIPVFEDFDCNEDDWFLIDLSVFRIAMWVPPTIERFGKLADSNEAFIKTYYATYDRMPRRMVQIYNCITTA